jgi:hypothetical protein
MSENKITTDCFVISYQNPAEIFQNPAILLKYNIKALFFRQNKLIKNKMPINTYCLLALFGFTLITYATSQSRLISSIFH